MKFVKKLIATSILGLSVNTAHANVIDFNTEMNLYGNAYINESHLPNGVILTNNVNSQKGSAFTTNSFASISNFTASFDILMGWGNGADGMTFAWVSNPGVGGGGGHLGYNGLNGYSIEFDTYNNGSWDQHSNNHVAVNGASVSNSLTQTQVGFDLNNKQYHHVDIAFNNGVVNVDIDGQNYINNFTIQNYQAFDGHFGFTAATGGLNDYHKVANFDLQVSAVPEPSTYAMMIGGLGLVGLIAARRKKG